MGSLVEISTPPALDTAVQKSIDGAAPQSGIQSKAKRILEESSTVERKKLRVDEGSGQTNGLMPHAELKTLGVRQYLEKTVVPVLLQGMQELVKTRPEDPFESLAKFIEENNPRKKCSPS